MATIYLCDECGGEVSLTPGQKKKCPKNFCRSEDLSLKSDVERDKQLELDEMTSNYYKDVMPQTRERLY